MPTQAEKLGQEWRPHQPIFGPASLWALGVAAAVTFCPAFIPSHGEEGWWIIALGLNAGAIVSIVSFLLALMGLARRENPRRPAITGFALSILPALGGIYLLLGAPW